MKICRLTHATSMKRYGEQIVVHDEQGWGKDVVEGGRVGLQFHCNQARANQGRLLLKTCCFAIVKVAACYHSSSRITPHLLILLTTPRPIQIIRSVKKEHQTNHAPHQGHLAENKSPGLGRPWIRTLPASTATETVPPKTQ